MIDIFKIVNFWKASTLTPVGNSKKLSSRSIGNRTFQFDKKDYRTRWRLGTRTIALAKLFGPLIQAGVKAGDLKNPDDEKDPAKKAKLEAERMGVMMQFLPDLMESADSDELNSLIDDLCTGCWVQQEDGTMVKLDNDVAGEYAFGDDLTLRIPVAVTALEVNLADGFFDRILAALPSTKSPGQNLGSTSEGKSQINTAATAEGSPQTS